MTWPWPCERTFPQHRAEPDIDIDLDAVADRVADADLELPTLTDEELAALGDLHRRPVVVPPGAWFGGLEGAVLEAVVRCAARSLSARAIARPVPGGELELSPPLATLLGIRRGFATLAQVDVEQDGVSSSRWLYRPTADVVLEERTDPAGFHAFRLRSEARTALDLHRLLDPEGRARDEGEPIRRGRDAVPSGWADVEEAVATAHRRLRIVTAHRVGERRVVHGNALLVSGPSGVWVLSGVRPEEPDVDEERVTARELSPTGVAAVLLACLRPPQADTAAADSSSGQS